MEKRVKEFDLQNYMSQGVANVVKNAIKATFKNPKQAAFLAGFAVSAKNATKKRKKLQEQGEHIPAFLITSITSSCNLHCAGCYARQNHACSDEKPVDQLPREDWRRIFEEAEQLGISFVLLAGGEPLLRYDVIEEASLHRDILFPIFTNGFYVGDKYIDLFDRHRNLLPIISVEGDQKATDERRGVGVYEKVIASIQALVERDIMYGVSVTVTKENMTEVYSESFVKNLIAQGCKVVIYVEYVPVSEETIPLAPDDAARKWMQERLMELRTTRDELVFISFPGDEKSTGGCVAAGRGFFHINSHGGAEPCPFSPYSDVNVRDTSLREALNSKLFRTLREEGMLHENHVGGCILFEKRAQVERILQG